MTQMCTRSYACLNLVASNLCRKRLCAKRVKVGQRIVLTEVKSGVVYLMWVMDEAATQYKISVMARSIQTEENCIWVYVYS